MISTRALLLVVRILKPPSRRPAACSIGLWNVWSKFRIRLIGEPRIVKNEAERQRLRAMPKASFYAVKVGRKPGIYDTWAETTAQVDGYPNAKHKKFKSREEAEVYLSETSSSHPGSSTNANAVAGPSRTSQSSSRAAQTSTNGFTPSPASRARSTSPLSSVSTSELDTSLLQLAQRGYHFARSSGDIKGKARLVVYCDGSGIGNGQKGARAGAGVWWGSIGEASQKSVSERVPGPMQTNNRGELLAVILALEQCPYPDLPLEIRTDSQYTISCMTTWLGTWLKTGFKLGTKSKGKPYSSNGHGAIEAANTNGQVKNADLIKHLLVLLRRRGQSNSVRFKYVPAHVGVEGNESADRLAKLGAGLPALPDRRHWLDPDVDQDLDSSLSSEPVNIDFEIDADMLMTAEELAAFGEDDL